MKNLQFFHFDRWKHKSFELIRQSFDQTFPFLQKFDDKNRPERNFWQNVNQQIRDVDKKINEFDGIFDCHILRTKCEVWLRNKILKTF